MYVIECIYVMNGVRMRGMECKYGMDGILCTELNVCYGVCMEWME